jgi:hypothetical protein
MGGGGGAYKVVVMVGSCVGQCKVGKGRMQLESRWFAKGMIVGRFMYRMMGNGRRTVWEQDGGRMIEGKGDRGTGGTTVTHLVDGKPKKLQECINHYRGVPNER